MRSSKTVLQATTKTYHDQNAAMLCSAADMQHMLKHPKLCKRAFAIRIDTVDANATVGLDHPSAHICNCNDAACNNAQLQTRATCNANKNANTNANANANADAASANADASTNATANANGSASADANARANANANADANADANANDHSNASADAKNATMDAGLQLPTCKSWWDAICDEFADVFMAPTQPHERDIKHRIELLDPAQPIPNHKQYRLSQPELDEAKRQIQDLLEKG